MGKIIKSVIIFWFALMAAKVIYNLFRGIGIFVIVCVILCIIYYIKGLCD